MNSFFTKNGKIKYSSILKISVIISLFIVALSKFLDQQSTITNASVVAISIMVFFIVFEALAVIYVSFKDYESRFLDLLNKLIEYTKNRIHIAFSTVNDYFYENQNCDYQYSYKKFHVIRC